MKKRLSQCTIVLPVMCSLHWYPVIYYTSLPVNDAVLLDRPLFIYNVHSHIVESHV